MKVKDEEAVAQSLTRKKGSWVRTEGTTRKEHQEGHAEWQGQVQQKQAVLMKVTNAWERLKTQRVNKSNAGYKTRRQKYPPVHSSGRQRPPRMGICTKKKGGEKDTLQGKEGKEGREDTARKTRLS